MPVLVSKYLGRFGLSRWTDCACSSILVIGQIWYVYCDRLSNFSMRSPICLADSLSVSTSSVKIISFVMLVEPVLVWLVFSSSGC